MATNTDLEVQAQRLATGITGPATLADLRKARYGESEHAFWAARSGLPFGSLTDHKLKAMMLDTGRTEGTLADVAQAYWAKNSV